MSETNGNPEGPQDRLSRLEASHLQLMTDHEVFWAQHRKFVEEQDLEWQRQQERWRHAEARGEDLDRRIAALVSGLGEFMRREK